jgi:hypothetical protein
VSTPGISSTAAVVTYWKMSSALRGTATARASSAIRAANSWSDGWDMRLSLPPSNSSQTVGTAFTQWHWRLSGQKPHLALTLDRPPQCHPAFSTAEHHRCAFKWFTKP